MSLNTFKTTLGYLKSLMRKYTPLDMSADRLEDIYNYLPISDLISTSGQPTEKQFEIIQAQGFEHVINLAPHNAENSLKNEKEILESLGMTYVHIPVNFVNPTNKKFEQFKDVMQELSGKKVWVHCAANMRVSAFMYRYRCVVLAESELTASEALHQIWKPVGVWKGFIEFKK
jgi:protein tyrosine phosphatase (PTP) superfamily phosphohydrolase (DUF442 family)